MKDLEIKISNNAGFCFGVKRAVDAVNGLLSERKSVATLGPIIHNAQMIDEFKEKGVKIISSVDEAAPGDVIVVRSHGVSQKVIDEIIKAGNNFVDATCPFVKKIHRIVSSENNKGKIALIAGDKNHPEVAGIVGNCCSTYYIFKNANELEKIIFEKKISENTPVIVLAQTTFDVTEWNKSLEILKNNCTNLQIFDTICNTTVNRQKEAERLSKICDVMIVIGGKDSSNTKKLSNICQKNCKTYHIETKNDLLFTDIMNANYVGITAGASTPANIIEEVKTTMENITKNNEMEENFEQLLEESLNKMSTDKKVKGTVIKITPKEVFVDIGRKQSGYVPLVELTNDTTLSPEEIVNIGDEIDLLIMRTDDQDGTIMLSKKRVDNASIWEELEASVGQNLTGKVIGEVKGGIIVLYKGARVFVPASMATARRGEPLDALKNQIVEFKLLEVDRRRRRVVGSIRAVLDEKRNAMRQAFWEKAKVGDVMTGTVRSFTPYGAFVDIGGLDGMIYIGDLSYEKVRHPSNVLDLGQQISVIVKELDQDKNKVGLGYKEQFENPWDTFAENYHVGDVVDAEIVNLTDFGAFARIIPGVDGMIHVSQISPNRIEKPSDALNIGQNVRAKIVEIIPEKSRIGLSMKEIEE